MTATTPDAPSDAVDESELLAIRRHKLKELRAQGVAFPNAFKPTHTAQPLHDAFGQQDAATVLGQKKKVALAGRIMMCRRMGKASFIQLQDRTGRIQLYLKQNDLGPECYEAFKHWDLGDVIGVEGSLFKTQTGELSVHASHIVLLTKSLRPLPDKFHGLSDKEICYRQRYVDLIANPATRSLFVTRSSVIQTLRQFFLDRAFLEVETPMLHTMPGGATARPFATHHHALDMPMFLRIAPELFLKRLIVGDLERVFEINRSFRNEGLSTRHNPEFTMIEFYQAYATYEDCMDLTEELMHVLLDSVLKTRVFDYQEHTIDCSKKPRRISMEALVAEAFPHLAHTLRDRDALAQEVTRQGLTVDPSWGPGKLMCLLFEHEVEDTLIQPTFVTQHPAEVSPLARVNDHDPYLTDRFEFYVAGRELANGFSELNDPEEQAQRFKEQLAAKDAGDEEAMHYDADYIRALEYGMPPTAGQGIGIDRLMMLLTNSASIKDVLLFPHMRPEHGSEQQA